MQKQQNLKCPNILAEFIVGQLKNKILFWKIMKKTIKLTEQADTIGIQIHIAGRIDRKKNCACGMD